MSRASVVSSFTIIKGALIEETYAILREWDFELSREENLRRVKATNAIGARTTSWLGDVCKVMHRRFDPHGKDRPLAELAKARCPYATWKPILLWHMTRDEFLLRDFLVHWLYPQFTAGALRIRTDDVQGYLAGLHERKLVAEPWTTSTLQRTASSLLRIAADFDLLIGTQVREFNSYHLPQPSFVYLLHAMSDLQPNARELVRSEDWAMYRMDADDVERELFRLHQFHALRYEVAGSLAQLSLPCATAAAYAREIAA